MAERNRIERISKDEFKLLCLLRNRQRRRISRFEIVINHNTGKIRCKELVDKRKRLTYNKS